MSMRATDLLHESWISMQSNRMRSFLTMLGMIIGVGAVVLMLAVGQGVQTSINTSIAAMGSNLFIVLSGSTSSGGVRSGSGNAPTLTGADGAALAEVANVAASAPVVAGSAQLIASPNNWSTQVFGVTPDYLTVRDWGVSSGTNFRDVDVKTARLVALVGQTVADNLFPNGQDPLGQTIRINKLPFTIVGVLTAKGQSMDGRDQDDTVMVPLTTAQRKLFGTDFPDSVRMIMVKTTEQKVMDQVQVEMTSVLRARHHLGASAEDDFTIRNLTAMAETAQEIGQTISLLLGSIASVSLLVGGIGIMNIMLVSVTERTREIGIRKAIGAYERDILLQFLLEAVLMSLTGGLLGIVLAFTGVEAIQLFTSLKPEITLSAILLAFFVSSFIGVVFGFFPARRAARLQPIEALRYS
jgi:putative ABC transport system permease protein